MLKQIRYAIYTCEVNKNLDVQRAECEKYIKS